MRRLGRVIHLTTSKMALIRAERPPKIGERVVDKEKKPVGTVFDIIGPTSSPYVEVKPSLEDPQRLVDHFLYVLPSPKHKRRMRKGRK